MAKKFPPRTDTPKPSKPPVQQVRRKADSVSPADAKLAIESRRLPSKVYNPKRTVRRLPKAGSVKTAASAFTSAAFSAANTFEELARALKNDVDLIYAFVHDNIDWLPTYGSQKGGYGALLDGVGNAFDQSELMIELLREAGYTCSFQLGELELTEAQVADWFGTAANNIWAASNLLSQGFIPNETYWTGSAWVLRMSHCWVKCTIGGTAYHFDPSFKEYNLIEGIDLADAMGYDDGEFMDNATDGATITADYVEDMNRTNVRADLATMTANLVDWIKTNNHAASFAEVVGGKTIVPVSSALRQTSLPYLRPSSTPTNETDIPNAYKTTLRVLYDDPNIDVTFYSKDIFGKRLTLTFNGSLEAELRLDGDLIATSDPQSAFSWNSVFMEVVHPYAVNWMDQGFWHVIWADHPYLLAHSWGNSGPGVAEMHREQLELNKFAGSADDDEDVVGEALAVTWHTWDSQKSHAADIIGKFTTCRTMLHHQLGVFGHFDSVYENLPGIQWTEAALDNDWPKTEINRTALAMHGVAFEAGVIEQTAGIGGVSTPSLIDIAVANGLKIYGADDSNWTSDVRPNLTNYDTGILDDIENWYINWDWRIILPEDGEITKDSWTGHGYFAVPVTPYSGAVGIIGGGLKGGAGAASVLYSTYRAKSAVSYPALISYYKQAFKAWRRNAGSFYASGYGSGVSWFKGRSPSFGRLSPDPVDLFTGQFLYDHVDLTVGSAGFPYGLSFHRFYNSGNRIQNKGLGLGWSHNHLMKLEKSSSGIAAMSAPIHGAAGIVQLFVTCDILSDLTKPLEKFVAVALANRWMLDQSFDNVVTITTCEGGQVFTKLPDGSYVAPNGNASTLVDNLDDTFTLTTLQGVEYNFNSDGDIDTIVFPTGPEITYTYSSGKLVSVANNMDRELTLSYTGDLLTSVSDGNGRSVEFGYTDDDLTTATDAEDKDTTFVYDIPGRMTQIFKPANPSDPIVTNTYDSLGRVMEQEDAYENVTELFIAGRRSEEKDPEGNSRVLYFNENGNIVKQVDRVGKVWLTEYDGIDRVVKSTAPEGNSVEYEYNEKHLVTTVTAKAKGGSGLSDIVNEFTYDPDWNKVATTEDGLGNITTFDYDNTTGSLLTITYPTVDMETPVVTFTYTGRGQVETITDPTGIITEFAYDGTDETLLSVVRDEGMGRLNLTTLFEYDAVGNVNSVTDPRGNESTMEYDDLRRLTKVTAPSPFGYETKFTYDDNHNRTKVERFAGLDGMSNPIWQTTNATYFIDDLLDTVTDPGSNATSFEYNTLRLLWKTTDALSRETTRAYDDAGRLSTVTNNASVVAQTLTYTDNGLVVSIEDGNENVTEFEFDGFDRLKKRIFADTSYEQLTYDDNNRVTNVRTRAADDIEFEYDELNRLRVKTPDNMAVVSYEYDLAGRIESVSTTPVMGNPASGEWEYGYDTAGRMTSEEAPDGKTVSYQLDENGNVTRITYPDTYYVEREYDELNRLTDVTLNGAMSSALVFEYDELSRRKKLTYGNGVETDYGFQLDNDLESLEHTFNGSSVEFTYGFNGAHEVTSQGVNDEQFMWHPASGGTVSYAAANELNQYTTVGGNSFDYNDNGCLIDDGVWEFDYDTENQLIAADDGVTSASYVYDPMRRQIQKNVGGTKTRYVYSGFQRIADYNGGSDTLLDRYVYGTGLDEPLIKVAAGGTLTYMHHDRIGSIIAITNSSGVVTNRYEYSPWGESGSMFGTSFGFTGQRYDSETGLYYYKNRHYSTETGRFLQPDPLGYSDSLNLYLYGFNNPTAFSDPLGLAADGSQLGSDTSWESNWGGSSAGGGYLEILIGSPDWGQYTTWGNQTPPGSEGGGTSGDPEPTVEWFFELAYYWPSFNGVVIPNVYHVELVIWKVTNGNWETAEFVSLGGAYDGQASAGRPFGNLIVNGFSSKTSGLYGRDGYKSLFAEPVRNSMEFQLLLEGPEALAAAKRVYAAANVYRGRKNKLAYDPSGVVYGYNSNSMAHSLLIAGNVPINERLHTNTPGWSRTFTMNE